MVKRGFVRLMILWVLFPIFLAAQGGQTVRVFADPDSNLLENLPIRGTISVEHPNTAPIDKTSFLIKNVPLKTEQIKEVRYSPKDPLTLTIFRFELPARGKGLYPLDEISVKVGGKVYKSAAASFEVKGRGGALKSNPIGVSPSKKKPMLILEAFIEPLKTLYPGQKTKVGYRYYYNQSIDATKEVLPLLEAEGLKKVGGKVVRFAQEGDMSLLEVAQVVQAIKPGVYVFPPSYFEGYVIDRNGEHLPPAIESETPKMRIEVIPLPEETKPASYKNGIGSYTFATKLETTPHVEVGEKMVLRASFTGAPLEDLELPDLCCQPGMAGRFHFGDIPPAPVLEGDTLHYSIEIRPIDPQVKEIPSLEFSYFDPEKREYKKIQAKAIPITVKPIVVEEETKDVAEVWPRMDVKPLPVTIGPVKKMKPSAAPIQFFESWWGLLTIPIAAILVLLQVKLKSVLEVRREQKNQKTSLKLLESLSTCPPAELPARIKECFLLKLLEMGEIPLLYPYEELTNDGTKGVVKKFLSQVDAWNYAQGEQSRQAMLLKAEVTYQELTDGK